MVRMRMSQDGGVERGDSTVEKLREQACSSEVAPVEIEGASAVHEDSVPAPAQKQGIPLPHVEGLEPETPRRPRWARPQGENEEENGRAQESRGGKPPGSEDAGGCER